MKLLDVLSGTSTANEGFIELSVLVGIAEGAAPETMPYGWQRGDAFGLGPQIDEWLDAHPGFVPAAYVAPPTAPELKPVDKLVAFLRANPDVAALLDQ